MFGHLLVADLHGHPRFVTDYADGGSRRFCLPVLDDPEPEVPWGLPPPPVSATEFLQVIETIDRYQEQGLTPAQLHTVRALWLERLTLREHAKREGVSPAAIHARIFGSKGAGGLVKIAPEFVAFWRSRHAGRCRKAALREKRSHAAERAVLTPCGLGSGTNKTPECSLGGANKSGR